MRRYGGGMLYAALPLHMQRGCFRIRTHDQQVTKARNDSERQIHLVLYFKIQTMLKLSMQTFSTFHSVLIIHQNLLGAS